MGARSRSIRTCSGTRAYLSAPPPNTVTVTVTWFRTCLNTPNTIPFRNALVVTLELLKYATMPWCCGQLNSNTAAYICYNASAPVSFMLWECRLHTPECVQYCTSMPRQSQLCSLVRSLPPLQQQARQLRHTSISGLPHPRRPPHGSHARGLTHQHPPYASGTHSLRSVPLSTPC